MIEEEREMGVGEWERARREEMDGWTDGFEVREGRESES